MVSRRAYGDKGIYVSLECNCDSEPEHGLQLVFKMAALLRRSARMTVTRPIRMPMPMID